jgi:hypothetical protein
MGRQFVNPASSQLVRYAKHKGENFHLKSTEGCNMTNKIAFVVFSIILIGASLASAQAVPDQIAYQGMLNDQSGLPVSGTVSFTFALYSVETGGTALWTESQSIAVSNGIFSVNLGASTPLDQVLFMESELYLGIRAGADQEMTPRQRIVSGAFAQSAGPAAALLNETVWPKHAGRDSSIVSYYGSTSTTTELGVIPVDKTFIITDIKCSNDNTRVNAILSYDAGAGAVTVYDVSQYGPVTGANAASIDTSFKAGIPIPGGASFHLSDGTSVGTTRCTVSGFEIPTP